MTTYNTQPENPTPEDRADELCSMLDAIEGTDDIGFVASDDSAIVTCWVEAVSAIDVREVAASEGFVEAGSYGCGDDMGGYEEVHISFDWEA